jgi:protoporphyrinogen oxidase
VHSLEPRAPEPVLHAADSLRYRDFLTVAVMVRDRGAFPDNWIYIQDGSVKVGRVQNFKSWSPEMVPDPSMACYGLEYFCFEGDGLWDAPDEELLALARRELAVLGLSREEDFVDGCVVRQRKAYPVYDEVYTEHVDTIRLALAEHYPGLNVVGRNGMHKYNNQDHSMMTSMLTVENILAGEMRYDVWRVNQDAEYIEAGAAGEQQLIDSGGRAVPRRVVET